MAQVQFLLSDSDDKQSLNCEARSSDIDDHDSLANVVAVYLADNFPGIVQAARLAKSQAVIREATQLMANEERDKAIQQRTSIVDEGGNVIPFAPNPNKLERLQ
jgi:hypothetical protein